jgi:hypothetical protein
MNNQDIADRLAITDQIYRYCRSVDRLDVPLGHGVFHSDSYADFGSYKGSGRGWIDFICKEHLKFLHHSHQVTNIINRDRRRPGRQRVLRHGNPSIPRRREGISAPVLGTLCRHMVAPRRALGNR